MKKATYREITDLLKAHEPFVGSSVKALYNMHGFYEVYSYQTCILSFDPKNNKVLMFDSDFYSRTTSRLQNILRSVFEIN